MLVVFRGFEAWGLPKILKNEVEFRCGAEWSGVERNGAEWSGVERSRAEYRAEKSGVEGSRAELSGVEQ